MVARARRVLAALGQAIFYAYFYFAVRRGKVRSR